MAGIFSALGGKLLEIVLPSLVTAIGGLVAAVLTRKLKQLGLELDAQQSNKLAGIVADAIRSAEEAARRTPAMTSAAKRQLAEAIVLSKAPNLGLTVIGDAIDAALPTVRLELRQTSHGPIAVPIESVLTSRTPGA